MLVWSGLDGSGEVNSQHQGKSHVARDSVYSGLCFCGDCRNALQRG